MNPEQAKPAPPKLRRRLATACIALTALSLSAQTGSEQAAVAIEPAAIVNPFAPAVTLLRVEARKPAPDFTLTDSNGQPLTLSGLKGKVVLLNFWATWCGGCKYELPWYVEFDRKYRQKGLAVVGVAMDDDGFKSVKPFLAEHSIPYPSVIGSDDLAKRFNLQMMPLSLLIDRQGRVAVVHQGVVDKAGFERHIQQLLRSS